MVSHTGDMPHKVRPVPGTHKTWHMYLLLTNIHLLGVTFVLSVFDVS